jgi:hypothetical protein
MGFLDHLFGQRTLDPLKPSRRRTAARPQETPSPQEHTSAQPQKGKVGAPQAPGMDLPSIPTWADRFWGRQEAALTATGTQFVLDNGPQLSRNHWEEEKTGTLSVHLIAGEPWLSWRGHIIGKMHRADREKAYNTLAKIDPQGWRLELPAFVGWTYQESVRWHENGTMQQPCRERVPVVTYTQPQWVTHDGRHDLTWFAQNPAPRGNVALLPSGGPLTVKLGYGAHQALHPYIRHGAHCGIYATLHMGDPEQSRSAPPCLVDVNGVTVGRLTPQSGSRMAPLIEDLAGRGYETATWAVLKGNTVAAELSVHPPRFSEVDKAWLILPDAPRPGPNG